MGSKDIATREQEFWFIMGRGFVERRRKAVERYGKFMAHSSLCKGTEGPFFRPPLPNPSHRSLCSRLGGVSCRRFAFRYGRYGLELEVLLQHGTPPLCSAGGLMSAFLNTTPKNKLEVIVFNCLTGSAQVLPRPAGFHGDTNTHYQIFMKVDHQNWSEYHIMLARGKPPLGYFAIFSSSKGYWHEGRTTDPKSPIANSSLSLEIANGDFFFSVVDEIARTCVLMAYHVEFNVWSQLTMPAMPELKEVFDGITKPVVATYKGRLWFGVLLNATHGLPLRRSLGFGVWELQPATSTRPAHWVEVARTPEHLWPPIIHESPYSVIYTLLSGGTLYYMTSKLQPPLVFDMAQNLWYRLPWDEFMRDIPFIMVHQPKLLDNWTSGASKEGPA